jgi:hypothetical protein
MLSRLLKIPYRAHIERTGGLKAERVATIAEILQGLLPDIDAGLLGDLGNRVRAETFDNCLDHGQAYLAGQQRKQAKVAAHVRTKATHARWDEFDTVGVRATIELTRQFLAGHLGG